ncbi:hypothetical protein ABZ650_20490 [Streptomyces griseoviridis]|uniref:hypothetical protein n=1 Tax=Streptomyces griseoviridis TaxID=45398 RepID=UPI00340CA471
MTIRTGARILAALSLIWSGYAISDLMNSGPWGITVALAGDIAWITILWAEQHRVRIAGRTWPATAAGWLIAAGVGALLAYHGGHGPTGSLAQAAAGVLVLAASKIVWMFALAADADPAALTAEQETRLANARRAQAYTTQLRSIETAGVERDADARIARIRADGRVTLAQDEVDFEVQLERYAKVREIDRRTPLGMSRPVHALTAPSGRPDMEPDTTPDASGQPDSDQTEPSGHDDQQPDADAATSQDTRPDTRDALFVLARAASGPSDLVRALVAHGIPKDALVSEAVRLRPDMLADSIRRTAKRLGEGPYL